MSFSSPLRAFFARVLCLFIVLTGLSVQAHAYIHPCIPTTLQELDTIKANLDKEPWKSGYAKLAASSTSQLTWNIEGPFANVSRRGAYDQNLGAWQNSMNAVYNLARMWYFTGNAAYAQKAHDILLAWATTHTSFTGNESGLALGDHAQSFAGGASILRGTWPGWTAADTTTVKNYFLKTLWPATLASGNTLGPANKGAIYLEAGIGIAVFCDDTAKFNQIISLYRTFHGSGLMNTLPTGQMGETGRDAGHCFGTLNGLAFAAEVAWKQGVDLYSELDNRLLACGEYYARNTLALDNPYIPFGTIDWQWINNTPGPYTANRGAFYILQNAYKNRKGLPTPWIDRKMQEQGVDGNNFMYAKTADFTTATVTPPTFPAVSPAANGLTLTTLGTKTAGRSASYSNGTWTMTGLGNSVASDTIDDCQFAYQQMTGDCAMVAQVTSTQLPGAQAKAGLMIRDNLTANISQRAWVSIKNDTSLYLESHMRGWTENWGGSGYDDRSHMWTLSLPYWIKIERLGKQITTFVSKDGASWSPLNCTYYGNLPSTLYLGLFVCSGATSTNTATFANVAFTGGSGGLVTTPAAPVAVLASGSSKVITVRWQPSYGATAYDVLRSTTSGSGYTALASNLTAGKTSHVDTTAAAGTTYYYVVRAKNSVGTSSDSPQFGAALLPPAMVNLAFGGTTLASINTGAQVGGSNDAFDGDPASKWYGYNAATGWLQYDFGAGNAQTVKRYSVAVADVADRDPKGWNFLGSQNGTTWTTLDSQSNQTFSVRYGVNSYNIGNTTAYRYYRIEITANNGGTSGVAIGDLGLWGDTGRTIPDFRYRLVNRKSNKVIDVVGTSNSSQVLQQTFEGDDSQQWMLAWQGNGVYRASNVAASKVLDNGSTSTAGANLVIQPSGAGTSQLWKFIPDGDGFYRIESVNSGRVADTSSGSTADGANIVQAASTSNSASQQWMPGVAIARQAIPATPGGLTATAASLSQIDLTWTASPGAISYSIKRAIASGGPYTAVSVPVNTTSYSDIDLLSSTTYYYVVATINGSGESTNSTQASATTLTAPPPAPTELSVILGTNRATLSWTNSGGATSYNVKRATSPNGPYSTIATGLTGTTFLDTGLTTGVIYYYMVSASNTHGTGPGSSVASAGPGPLSIQLKFDETDGTIAPDSGDGMHHATLVNGPNFVAGTLDNALALRAASFQYAQLPSGMVSGLTDFTISAWVKVETFATWQRIFDFGSGTNNCMYLASQGPVGSGRPRFSIRTMSVAEQVLDSSIALTAGAWSHIAVTRSGNTVSLYINGVPAGSGNMTLNPADLGFTTQNYLGRSQFADPYFNGSLDDFRLYTQALSIGQILALAHPPPGVPTRLAAIPGDTQVTLTWSPNATTTHTLRRATNSGGPYSIIANGVTDLTYNDTGLTNGVTYYYIVSGANTQGSGLDSAKVSTVPNTLALHLKFDETGGSTSADASGRNFNATLINAPGFSSGRIYNGLNLTASSSQHATLPSGIVSGMGDFTISTWVKVTSFATWQRIFDFGTGANNYMYLTTQYTTTAPNAAKLRFGIRTPSIGEQNVNGTSIAITAGAWTHVAVTRSGTTVSIYVNGSPAGSGTIALSPADLGATTQNYLGKSQFNDPYLNGSLDDFRLYSKALSAAEIAAYALPLAAPQNLAATSGPLSLNLGWSAVANATGYTMKYATQSGGPYTTLTSGLATPGRSHSGLSYGTPYYYVVSATNSIYESPPSAELMATPDSALISGAESVSPGLMLIPGSSEDPAVARLAVTHAVIGHTYQLQTTTNLTSSSWENVGESLWSDGSPVSLEAPYDPSEPRRFYRVVITR